MAYGDNKRTTVLNSQQAYQDVFEISKKQIQPTHPIPLGLAHNFSVLYYEILNSPGKVCSLDTQHLMMSCWIGYNESRVRRKHSDDAGCLRDNFILWTSEKQEDEEDAGGGGEN